ncbi:MAG TPA: hypothetical protein VFS24_20465 [Steroidobacteraceae bacterium]|nr:hypothetical protein [Steroidobacteraceae bacterium]
MTPADRRISELIDKWLVSIDLHLKYTELSDAAYARVQPWPKHDRPTRWVLEVARQKILELKAQCETRQAMGDSRFAEALELMAFLANLVGIQHIQRFIPLADPAQEGRTNATSQTVEAPTVIQSPPVATPPARSRPPSDETTREMPRLKVARAAARTADPTPAARPSEPPKNQSRPAPAPAQSRTLPASDMRSKIVADAIRLLKWGKSWHELADLIARIAERPPAAEIRKVLRANKAEIETKAAQA